MKHLWISAILLSLLAACTDRSDDEYRAEVVAAVHASIDADLAVMLDAASHLQAAAPNRPWDASKDAEAIRVMQCQWRRMRASYERVEGAIVALFPDLDVLLDGRYEEMLGAGDDNLFDATGVTGMHGIERILYASAIRPEIIAVESELVGYTVPSYPATINDAASFKTYLVQRLIDDATALRLQWTPETIDVAAAYRGLIGLMNEQKEKVDLAVTGEEESRYANITLFDLRCNLEGTKTVYELFRPWIHTKSTGPNLDSALLDKLGELAALYQAPPIVPSDCSVADAWTGDALPMPPADWVATQPTAANLTTPFGVLWQGVRESVDPQRSGSVVYEMNRIGTLLGFPAFVDE